MIKEVEASCKKLDQRLVKEQIRHWCENSEIWPELIPKQRQKVEAFIRKYNENDV